jgi:hypothetical protein
MIVSNFFLNFSRLFWLILELIWESIKATGNYILNKISIPINKLLFMIRGGTTVDNGFLLANNLIEPNGKPIIALKNHPILNFAQNINATPQITFVPKTKSAICQIIKWAKKNNKRIRAGGFRHTLSNLYTESTESIFISMIDLRDAEILPLHDPIPDLSSDLVGIEILKEIENGTKVLARIGAATTNEQLRSWANQCITWGKISWTLPFNVIVTEITIGGSNSTMSHGAGINHPTLSDLVHEIEFVNANGELQIINDKEQLKAAAGCLGLLGIVTSLTLKLDKMTYANFKPQTVPIGLGVPPIDVDKINLPANIKNTFFGNVTPQQIKTATQTFYDQCENYYYAEWFWFVFSDTCFVNVWKNDASPSDANFVINYPTKFLTQLQAMLLYVYNLIEVYLPNLSNFLPPVVLSSIFSISNFYLSVPAVMPLTDALHFRRGLQNFRARNIEFIIPIPPTINNTPDWSICQQAWWDVISLIYSYNTQKQYPCQITVEMRVLADSNIYLAPENGNTFGSCSIECVTINTISDKLWIQFTQDILNIWSKYTDHKGNLLRIRPHWAKEWNYVTVHGKPMIEYLKSVNKDSYNKFRQQVSNIAHEGKYSTSDLKIFSNKTLDEFDFY